MTEPRPNRERARRAANEILQQCGVSALPVDLDRIAAELGIEVEERPMQPGFFGATAHDGVRTRILISLACFNPAHRRFTMAHELGHCCIGGHAEVLFARGNALHYSQSASGGRRDPIEVEADNFAAFLLMPEHLVAGLATARPPCMDVVRTIATAADTSLTAAAIRATELIPDPFAIVLSERGVIEWASFSAAMRTHYWAGRSYKGESLPTDSVSMSIAKSAAGLCDEAVARGETCVAEWFPSAPGTPAIEEALGLGDYGKVLTVLFAPALPSEDMIEHSRRRETRSPADWRDALRSYQWDDPNQPDE